MIIQDMTCMLYRSQPTTCMKSVFQERYVLSCVAAPIAYKNVISNGQAFSEITDIQFLGSLSAYGYISEDIKCAVLVIAMVSIKQLNGIWIVLAAFEKFITSYFGACLVGP